MDKYIGFDMDDKKTIACLIQEGRPDLYATLPTEVAAMGHWLNPDFPYSSGASDVDLVV